MINLLLWHDGAWWPIRVNPALALRLLLWGANVVKA
jgi:hypothetical protein